MKFKIGDRVKVKSLKEIKKLPYHKMDGKDIRGKCEDTDKFGNIITAHNTFIDDMCRFCGKEFVIEVAYENGNYKLSDGECSWYFIASWLELLSQHYVETFDEE